MIRKKYLITCLCAFLTLCSLAACNTSQKAAEATTERMEVDINTETLLKGSKYNIPVTLPKNYDKITVNLNGEAQFSEEELNEYIDGILSSFPDYEKADHDTVKSGDVVDIDYELTNVSGEDGNQNEKGYMVKIGSAYFTDAVDKGLIGKKADDSFEIKGTYPEGYSDELVGKEFVFSGKVNGIYKEKPVTHESITDGYIKENFSDSYEASTKDDFIAKMEEEYNTNLEYDKESLISEKVQESLLKNVAVEVPDKVLKKEIKEQKDYLEETAELYGMTYEDFLKNQYDMTEADLEKEVEQSIKLGAILEAIVKDKNIGISSKEFEESMSIYLSYGYESLDDFYKERGGKEVVMLEFAENKALDELIYKAVVIE